MRVRGAIHNSDSYSDLRQILEHLPPDIIRWYGNGMNLGDFRKFN